MSKGYIYCVSTPANNDRCKVGETLRGIEDRLKGLNTTSVSENFKLDYYIVVDAEKRYKIESAIHNDIITEGYSRFSGKEFFKCQPNDIKHIFKNYGDIYTTINEHKNFELNENINILLSKSYKKYKCEKCNKEFNRKSGYDSHISRIRSCVKDNNINNVCEYCNKHYSTRFNLNAHLNSCKEKLSKYDDPQSQIEESKKMIFEYQRKFEEQQIKIEKQQKQIEELSNGTKINYQIIKKRLPSKNIVIKYSYKKLNS